MKIITEFTNLNSIRPYTNRKSIYSSDEQWSNNKIVGVMVVTHAEQ